jgi:hypothetical protein
MDNNKLIKQIGNIIEEKLEKKLEEKLDKKLEEKLAPIKKQLDTVELKVELVNKRVEQAQEETIEVLSDLIHTSYDLHEKRIRKIENNLGITTPHQ